MADCCSRSVVTLVAILLFVGIGGMICGAIGTSWFTQSRLDTHVGLLKSCTRILGRCTERKNILKFKEEHEAFFVGVESRCKLGFHFFDLNFIYKNKKNKKFSSNHRNESILHIFHKVPRKSSSIFRQIYFG